MINELFRDLETICDNLDDLGEGLTIELAKKGMQDAETAKRVCDVLASFADARNSLRIVTALVSTFYESEDTE